MWMMILMSNKWYAKDLGNANGLHDALDDIIRFANEGTVVSICDDLETWCGEMNVNLSDVIMAEAE